MRALRKEEAGERFPPELLKTAAEPEPSELPATDKEQAVRDLIALLDANPGLGAAIADLIEQYLTGGGRVTQAMAVPPAAAPAVGAAPATAPGVAPGAAPAAVPEDLLRRIAALEEARENDELEKQLAAARKVYDTALKQHLPILPDMDERAVLQMVLKIADNPIEAAVKLYALEKALEGEGTLADRLIAKHMEASKAKALPRVEGPGGAIPAGAHKMPESMREAHARAREMLRALFATPGS